MMLFFFKQKTAYEMRISDWSSDVCSSDLGGVAVVQRGAPETAFFAFMGDEHAALIAPEIGQELQPGDPVSLTVPHCDPTVNLYDFYHVVSGDTLIDIWPVSARGRAR